MAKAKQTTKAKIEAMLKTGTTVPELTQRLKISKAHARTVIFSLGDKVKRSKQHTLYNLVK